MKPFKWILPTEKEIQNAILEYLNSQPGCMAFQVNTTGVYDQKGGFYRRPGKWVAKGCSDIICILRHPYRSLAIFFEVKSETGRQSPEQLQFQQKLKDRCDGYYFVVRSIKEAEDIISKIQFFPSVQIE